MKECPSKSAPLDKVSPPHIYGQPPLRCASLPSAASPESPSSLHPSLLGSQSPSSLLIGQDTRKDKDYSIS